MELVRVCPSCGSERPMSEMLCAATTASGGSCNWRLADVAPTLKGRAVEPNPEESPGSSQEQTVETAVRVCENGHIVPDDEFMCLECGADVAAAPEVSTLISGSATAPASTNNKTATAAESHQDPLIGQCIEGWVIREHITSTGKSRDCFRVENTAGEVGFLVLFHEQYEPDTSIYDVLRNTDHDHVPDILLTGRWNHRSFEIIEWIDGGSLVENDYFHSGDLEVFRRITEELGRALHDLAEMGVRHRNICPRAILIRRPDPLDLVITDFSSARLSDFDLDTVATLDITRYSAPEAIVGGVSTASDWWGLGMILLEQATAGSCFEGINERAFTIHVVTRGIEIPDTVPPKLKPLLQGLLARDPLQRWQWEQVKRWLNDELVEVPQEHRQADIAKTNETLCVNDINYTNAEQLALGLATDIHWEAGIQCFETGALATWLQSNYGDTTIPAKVRHLMSDANLAPQWKYALALMELNQALPLVNQGTLVMPAWLLDHPEEGIDIITGELPVHLESMEREPWLVRLYYRRRSVLERARLLEIELDETRLKTASLATSRANLEAERDRLRELYPSSGHDALANLMEKPRLNEEDLVILLCAKSEQFTPLNMVVEEAVELTKKYEQRPMESDEIRRLVILPRRELYDAIDEKIADFARCDHPTLNHWADDFRVQRRISLSRAIVLLSLSDDAWAAPPKQDYAANILSFFEKRVANSVMRGPLVRLTIAKTSARIDMTELNSALKPATALIDHILSRNDNPVQVDPHTFQQDSILERRLWRLHQAASNNRRDTGIDSLYLGFPFLVIAGQQGGRPRVAPIFLWPIKMGYTVGSRARLTLSYDMDRAEMRINPALEGLIGRATIKKWRSLHSEVLEREKLNISEVMDAVGTLVPLLHQGLQTHPVTTYKVPDETVAGHGSAVIFNAQFSGQAIAEDLRQLQRMPITGTALESLLRITEPEPVQSTAEASSELDRFNVVPADPSQDKAVLQGRIAPGVVIEGPPGTGKSQTIVNIVADCLGRQEKVLVVCQKQAALRVVEKRLEAVNLSHRILTITDIGKDRQSVIRTIREQVPEVLRSDSLTAGHIRQNRGLVAGTIDQLETELNERHTAICQRDELSGLTYRQIICELIDIDSQSSDQIPVQPRLRQLLKSVTPATLGMLEDHCSSLASDWLNSNYEHSSLHCFSIFSTDIATIDAIKRSLDEFQKAEHERAAITEATSSDYDNKALMDLVDWDNTYLPKIKSLNDRQIAQKAIWFDRFYDEVNERSEGEDTLKQLRNSYQELDKLNADFHDDRFFVALSSMDIGSLQKLLRACQQLSEPAEGLARFSPIRFWRKLRIRSFLGKLNESYDQDTVVSLRDANRLELELAPLRRNLNGCLEKLSTPLESGADQTLKFLRRAISPVITQADMMVNLCKAVKVCPIQGEAKTMLRSGSKESVDRFVTLFSETLSRAKAREDSLNALDKLTVWMDADWIEQHRQWIGKNMADLKGVAEIIGDINTLETFQRFRLRTKTIDPIVLHVFKELRDMEGELNSLPPSQLGLKLKQCVRRETYLGWKLRIEENIPSLLIGKQELEDKLLSLAEFDEQKSHLNQSLLVHDIPMEALGSETQWNEITRLRGERYKKLREFIDLGLELGLTDLRPVWMMSPEAVSQALPRVAGMFDVVVFDEASQMMVDFAIPALYRAKRVIISGDEKQMPPSSFFSSSVELDEDDSIEELDEDASEAEVSQHEDAWNRREIKDCPDLLVLGKTVLPTRTLEIHYRSAYRALIDFSNFAYYSGKLHIPALHPEEVVIREKPIDVHHVNGVYTDQTNAEEADKIVELIADIWKEAPKKRPSLGVVTFNKKQSELIEDTLQAYAEQNPDFYQAYLSEQDRQQNGEDMGFFVKNVENVQGDERDVILFSTTFGLNEHGSFRRNFGVLGHKGGERRLNVAVTRARHKVIIATSMPLRDISDMLATGRSPTKPRDFIQAYLEYASKISSGDIKHAKRRIFRFAQSVTQRGGGYHEIGDTFIQSVEQFIRSLGFQPERGANEDAFNVDLAIINPKTGQYGLGIECDAPINSLLHNTRARDIWRQRVLEKSIPLMHRINCYDWYQDNAQEKQKLEDMIKKAVGT
ncbi:hypothetical protein BTA51_26170 [Hahella sp. CCB-MM4]|uniref:AAA domain-containing protein n=1 Tax=Hahella sp. (strain CCB-MM4) TaxID=1926491 RepID=UPI000B9B0A99|nr:AAA domain-containing protein [Hahella sp. CCB-MM4]OZG70457.1 hypothetical protein BTA51_26170 [Hahella sp. CCB-MM4]